MEYSLGILKPDCLERDLVDHVFGMIKNVGLEVVVCKKLHLAVEDIYKFYYEYKYENFFDGLIQSLTCGNVIAYIVRGENAIDRLNTLVGRTDPAKATPNTIRELGESIRKNLVHSSEDKESFLREASLIFSDQELNEIIK